MSYKEIKYIKLPPAEYQSSKDPNDQALSDFLYENNMSLTEMKALDPVVEHEWLSAQYIQAENDLLDHGMLNCVTCGSVIGNYDENCSDEDDNLLHPLHRIQYIRYIGE